MKPSELLAGRKPSKLLSSALALSLTASAAVLLNSCGLAREAMYAPRNDRIVIEEWTKTRPLDTEVKTDDGLRLQGFYFPGAPDDPDIFIFFHGRGAHQGVGAKYAQYLATEGNAVLVASYRGFGGNPGSPSRKGMLKDATAFLKEARALKGPGARLWLVGHSLGGAVALQSAASHGDVAGVIALSTFATVEEAAPALVRGFLPDAWDNLQLVGQIGVPLLILQGNKDDVIPLNSGAQLLAAAHGPAAYISMLNRTHKPYMQELGPWTSKAIAAMSNNEMDMLPELPADWILAGTHVP